ncbi:TPA: class A beta-lactamase [Citrobacter koseri]|nr:class A beta-lactamase [Citrobacter koseri]HEM8010840.1 class A beta-lactamase [Citrobacter koseri]
MRNEEVISMWQRMKWGLCVLAALSGSAMAAPLTAQYVSAIAMQEEQRLHARIGIAVLDTATNSITHYRGEERFPLNSTHKPLLCAALLREVDRKALALSASTQFEPSQLVEYSPITEKHVAPDAMSWAQLCSAAVSYSDNTAANLIARKLNGPQAVTQFLRDSGDTITRLDRYEPELNSAIPGDERDSTTPVAIAQTLNTLLLGNVLQPSSRDQLMQWMRDDKVADGLLRSVLPDGWKIADKTGAGDNGSRSIVSVVWPTSQKPLLVVIYITQTPATMAQRDAAIVRIGESLFSTLAVYD